MAANLESGFYIVQTRDRVEVAEWDGFAWRRTGSDAPWTEAEITVRAGPIPVEVDEIA
jgi:hypothetical protein